MQHSRQRSGREQLNNRKLKTWRCFMRLTGPSLMPTSLLAAFHSMEKTERILCAGLGSGSEESVHLSPKVHFCNASETKSIVVDRSGPLALWQRVFWTLLRGTDMF
eukprot:2008012-Rhodomonas_salina.2